MIRPSSRSRAVLATVALLSCLGALPLRAERGDMAAYDESSALKGRTLVEKLAMIGQLDRLDDTASDRVRGACAATLNAYLLLGGDFAAVARELGVRPKLTYENVHRLQDLLHRQADRDGEPGILATAEAVYDTNDVLVDWSMRGGDEYHLVLQKLNLSAERIYGPTRATVNRKGDRIQQLLGEDSTRVFVVGVLEDMESRTSHQTTDGTPANHHVLAFWYDGAFHAIDSWRPPGESGLVRWSAEAADGMLFETRNVVYWVWRR